MNAATQISHIYDDDDDDDYYYELAHMHVFPF